MVSSPEVTGGAGLSFEASVVAFYLTNLLVEGGLRGLGEYVVSEVLVQRRALGEPLDDLIVRGTDRFGNRAKLSLQVKQSLTVSDAATNEDFREIVHRGWQTMKCGNFQLERDRIGAVTAQVSFSSFRDARVTCEWARNSTSAADFTTRLRVSGLAGNGQRDFVEAVRSLISEVENQSIIDDDVWNFLRSFVLLRFDLRSEGADDDYFSVERLRIALGEDGSDRAPELWKVLFDLAFQLTTSAGSQSRHSLLTRLAPSFQLQRIFRYKTDLINIAEEANHCLGDIRLDIAGRTIARQGLVDQADDLLSRHRFLQLTGEPGTGKSALLRLLAERQRADGFALILKSDRLVGPGWPAYASHLRLETPRLGDLLIELACTSKATLFIDGVDRVMDRAHRETIKDIVRTILTTPALEHWRIVATVRDGNLEHVRTWLPDELVRSGNVASLPVPAFDDAEAKELGTEHPWLRPLLFGTAQVREIARRPFFLRVLASAFSSGNPPPAVSSEPELIIAWWLRGGYDAEKAEAALRQQVLLAIAKAGGSRLGRGVPVGDNDSQAIQALIEDGILIGSPIKQTVSFLHDIFFEWTFFMHCKGQGEAWLDEILRAGEPPGLGRIVELLSQSSFESDQNWASELGRLEKVSARSQWNRAWLLAPFGSPRFEEFEDVFSSAILNNVTRLSKLLIWYQAVQTVPNSLVIQGGMGNLDRFQRMRLADVLGWPRDLSGWTRLLRFLFTHIDRIPVDLTSDVLTLFDVWLNALGEVPNPVNTLIAAQARRWLSELEEGACVLRPGTRSSRGRWKGVASTDQSELETRARATFLRACRSTPETLGAYLDSVKENPELLDSIFEELLRWSPTLAQSNADKLVDVTLAAILEELPDEKAKQRYGLIGWSPQFNEVDSPSIKDHIGSFRPASPIQEPFRSLFGRAPEEALRLVRTMSTHMMEAWRQLQRYERFRKPTPLPLDLDFPWGSQRFWGDERVYLWYRGVFASDVISSAFMALEDWAFGELERGRDVDRLIEIIVKDNPCVAVLGIAIALAIETKRVSPATFPLVTSQRLWRFDVHRFGAVDSVGINPNEMGINFWETDNTAHLSELRRINSRGIRKQEIRSLAGLFTIFAKGDLYQTFAEKLKKFPEDLPFDYQEESGVAPHVSDLKETAEYWAELGDRGNFVKVASEDGNTETILFENPRPPAPSAIEAAGKLSQISKWLAPLHWAKKCFTEGRITGEPISEAIQKAGSNDAADLFSEDLDNDPFREARRSGVVASAAAVLSFAEDLDPQSQEWALGVLLRASRTPPSDHGPWSREQRSIDHPVAYAALGIAAYINRFDPSDAAKEQLLRLIGYPVDDVAESAIRSAMSCWKIDANFAWVAFRLGMQLSVASRGQVEQDLGDETDETAPLDDDEWIPEPDESIREAIRDMQAGNEPEETIFIPPAWAKPDQKTTSEEEEDEDEPPWGSPDQYLRWDFCARVLKWLPPGLAASNSARWDATLKLAKSLHQWTIDKFAPPWLRSSDHRKDVTPPYTWRSSYMFWLVSLTDRLEPSQVKEYFIDPILALPSRFRAELISAFVNAFVSQLMDAPVLERRNITLLIDCFEPLASDSVWERARHNPSRGLDNDYASMVRMLLMNFGQLCSGARRFANGDWSDVSEIRPLVNSILMRVGDVPYVFGEFLDLVERSFDHYALDDFLDQLFLVPESLWSSRAAWNNTMHSAQLAALIQSFAEREMPLSAKAKGRMLTILDWLIEVGDRRSAALQTSEFFVIRS
jgi:hypothetical protein